MRERERDRERSLFKWCQNLPGRHSFAGCLSGVGTYLWVQQFILPPQTACPPGASCPGISCPTPWLSTPGGQAVQASLSCSPPNTRKKIYTCYFVIFVLCCRGAGCLSGVRTYLPGTVLLWCRLFKQCHNLPVGHCVAMVQAV